MPTQDDINHQQKLLAIHRRNLQLLLKQAAKYGGETVAPLYIINAIEDDRTNIRRIKKILREWQASVTDHIDDEPPDVTAAV